MRALFCLVLCGGAAQAAVPEPAGSWMGAPRGDVPAGLAGGRVIHTDGLAALLARHAAVLIDVSPAPKRPPNMAAGALWLPLAHLDIPGSVWLPGAGQPDASAAMDGRLRQRLAALSHHEQATPMVVYCHPHCWLSWNAAKRFVAFGYQAVYWYPDGIEGWTAAGHPAAPAKPEGSGTG